MTEAAAGLRLDKWLFYARVFKTRALASDLIEGGKIRVNGQPCRKPAKIVRIGDTLRISANKQIRNLTVVGFADRRGPAPEASMMYLEAGDGLIDPAEATR
ncbi:RNA-binding S4 domain-containing protein [Paracoccus sp. JM45]|uniref:RNA-binding S4 domain-containing protein n=1 Tax=Paracoccus sp. JM45 TaxID=2283626 RepID=UPI000E6C5F5A|nr:RNA-binding S4 domain-containing protein [Paracoccus sp. JM45]RJE80148.1 RNA-binding S4 domain-containing protein [Paracoccus sp. JM45]